MVGVCWCVTYHRTGDNGQRLGRMQRRGVAFNKRRSQRLDMCFMLHAWLRHVTINLRVSTCKHSSLMDLLLRVVRRSPTLSLGSITKSLSVFQQASLERLWYWFIENGILDVINSLVQIQNQSLFYSMRVALVWRSTFAFIGIIDDILWDLV